MNIICVVSTIQLFNRTYHNYTFAFQNQTTQCQAIQSLDYAYQTLHLPYMATLYHYLTKPYVTLLHRYNTQRHHTFTIPLQIQINTTIANKNKLESSFYTTLQLISLLFISDIFPAETSFAGIVPLTKSVKLTIIKPFNDCIHQIICKCSNFNFHSTSCRNRFRAR